MSVQKIFANFKNFAQTVKRMVKAAQYVGGRVGLRARPPDFGSHDT